MAFDERSWQQFVTLFDHNKAAIKEITELFLRESRSSGQTIMDAGQRGDLVTLHRAAHTLKSTSRQLGGRDLGETCRILEDAGRAGDVDTVRGHLDSFEAHLEALHRELQGRLVQ